MPPYVNTSNSPEHWIHCCIKHKRSPWSLQRTNKEHSLQHFQQIEVVDKALESEDRSIQLNLAFQQDNWPLQPLILLLTVPIPLTPQDRRNVKVKPPMDMLPPAEKTWHSIHQEVFRYHPCKESSRASRNKISSQLFLLMQEWFIIVIEMAEATGGRVNCTRCSTIALFQHRTSWNINIKPATLAALSLC